MGNSKSAPNWRYPFPPPIPPKPVRASKLVTNLPVSVFVKIFDQLDTYNLRELSMVNKRFNNLVSLIPNPQKIDLYD